MRFKHTHLALSQSLRASISYRRLVLVFTLFLLGGLITFIGLPQNAYNHSSALQAQTSISRDGTHNRWNDWRWPSLDRIEAIGRKAVSSFEYSTLPECNRTVLYRFAGSHGFASEYLIFLRVALLAKHFEYELFIDDSHWNYGRWEDYFQPLKHTCSPPRLQDTGRVPISSLASDPPLRYITFNDSKPAWTHSAHTIWSLRKLDYLDEMVLQIYTDTREVQEFQAADVILDRHTLFLNTSETLPHAYRKIHQLMAEQVSELWQLNDELETKVSEILALQTEFRKACGFLIAAHVRLGDKAKELSKFTTKAFGRPRHSLLQLYETWYARFGTPSTAEEGGSSLTQPVPATSLLPRGSVAPGSTGSIHLSPGVVDGYFEASLALAKQQTMNKTTVNGLPVQESVSSTLLIMSDDTSGEGLQGFVKHAKETQTNMIIGVDALVNLSRPQSTPTHSITSSGASKMLTHGFHEAKFNAAPMSQRVADTKVFLRDLSVLSMLADGIVFTGSSNVGRLLVLLGSRNVGRNVSFSSVDVRWFPTARYQ